jgi:hypothetical protein
VGDFKFLTIAILAILGLGYCLWGTQADYRVKGLGWAVAWGLAASLSAFCFVVFILASQVLSDL